MTHLFLMLYFLVAVFAGAILSAKLDQKTMEIGLHDIEQARLSYNAAFAAHLDAQRASLQAVEKKNKECETELNLAISDLEVFKRNFSQPTTRGENARNTK